jgi:hypothetical protein
MSEEEEEILDITIRQIPHFPYNSLSNIHFDSSSLVLFSLMANNGFCAAAFSVSSKSLFYPRIVQVAK